MKNKFGNNINVSEYFSSDFNDAISGQSVQDYDDKFFIYDPFGRSGEIIEDDGSGNKAIKFYQNEYSTVRISHLELLLPPISTHDKVLTFEYSIKFLLNSFTISLVENNSLFICQTLIEWIRVVYKQTKWLNKDEI